MDGLSRVQVEVAAKAAAPAIVEMVKKACRRKALQGSPIIGGEIVGWDDYVAYKVLEALPAPSEAETAVRDDAWRDIAAALDEAATLEAKKGPEGDSDKIFWLSNIARTLRTDREALIQMGLEQLVAEVMAMRDSIETRVCTIVAEVLGEDVVNVRPESVLRGESLGLSWRKLYAISARLERDYGVPFDIIKADHWTTVTDIIVAVERAIATSATAIYATRTARGQAA